MPDHDEYCFDAATGRLHRDGPRQTDHTVFLPWPSPVAMTQADGHWHAARPVLDVRHAASAALACYLDTIPPEVLAIVRRFPDRHWDLLRLAAGCGDAATDLLEANPALGYMVAVNDEFRRVHLTDPPTVARMLLAPRRRQRDVLAWLRYPSTDAIRRIVRKIEHDAISVPRLLGLRDRIGDQECQRHLAHLPRLPEPVLALACERLLDRVAPALLRAMADGRLDGAGAVPQLVADTVRMWRMARPREAVPAFGGAGRLREEHDRLARTGDWLTEERRARGAFPGPPLQGTDDIVALTTARALVEEGVQQRNCVGSYAGRVRRRQVFVYRVLAPTRATLSLVRRDGRWRIDQLEASGNRPVPSITCDTVREWLRTAQTVATTSRPPARSPLPPGVPDATSARPGAHGFDAAPEAFELRP